MSENGDGGLRLVVVMFGLIELVMFGMVGDVFRMVLDDFDGS
jgi:hypothetical protein